jgi:uncharacterized protein YdcH (DUF465 family)
MKTLDHLNMQHRILDEQIDEMERKHILPDADEERLIQNLKKERLKIRDAINKELTKDGHKSH